MTGTDLTLDHVLLDDTQVTRRYFGKFEKITGYLGKVAAVMEAEGRFARPDIAAIARYLVGLNLTFRALAHKYHFAGHYAHAGKLTFDRVESGFPVYAELLNMANDAAQAAGHLAGLPSEEALKDQMVRIIVGERTVPTRLQYALSQRLYYQELAKGGLFWARNDPQAQWLENLPNGRRRFLIHWAVYDSQINLPTVYLLEVEDSGRTALPKDERRWPEVMTHLMAQSVAGLKLVTIARGFDADFVDLHPKRLRRLHLGPMYSSVFTSQTGPIRDVLVQAKAPIGEDWAFVWSEEDLRSDRSEEVKSGWFSSVERQIFALDPFAGQGADLGATSLARSIILPERPYQALVELNPPGFADVRKFVVGSAGRVLSYR